MAEGVTKAEVFTLATEVSLLVQLLPFNGETVQIATTPPAQSEADPEEKPIGVIAYGRTVTTVVYTVTGGMK